MTPVMKARTTAPSGPNLSEASKVAKDINAVGPIVTA